MPGLPIISGQPCCLSIPTDQTLNNNKNNNAITKSTSKKKNKNKKHSKHLNATMKISKSKSVASLTMPKMSETLNLQHFNQSYLANFINDPNKVSNLNNDIEIENYNQTKIKHSIQQNPFLNTNEYLSNGTKNHYNYSNSSNNNNNNGVNLLSSSSVTTSAASSNSQSITGSNEIINSDIIENNSKYIFKKCKNEYFTKKIHNYKFEYLTNESNNVVLNNEKHLKSYRVQSTSNSKTSHKYNLNDTKYGNSDNANKNAAAYVNTCDHNSAVKSKNQWIEDYSKYCNQINSINDIAHLSINKLNTLLTTSNNLDIDQDIEYSNDIQSDYSKSNMNLMNQVNQHTNNNNNENYRASLPALVQSNKPSYSSKQPSVIRRSSFLSGVNAVNYYKQQQNFVKTKRQESIKNKLLANARNNYNNTNNENNETENEKIENLKNKSNDWTLEHSKENMFKITHLFQKHFNSDDGHYATGMTDDSCRAALCIDLLIKLSYHIPSYTELIQFIAKTLSKYIFQPPTLLQQKMNQHKRHCSNASSSASSTSSNKTSCDSSSSCLNSSSSSISSSSNSTEYSSARDKNFNNPKCHHKTELLKSEQVIHTLEERKEQQFKTDEWFNNIENIKLSNLVKLPIYHNKYIETNQRIFESQKFLRKLELAKMFDANIYQSYAARQNASTIFKEWRKRARDRKVRLLVIKSMRNKNRRDWLIFQNWANFTLKKKKTSALLNADVAKEEIKRLHNEIKQSRLDKYECDKDIKNLKISLATTTDYIKHTRQALCENCTKQQETQWNDLLLNLKIILGSYRALIDCGIVENVKELKKTVQTRPSLLIELAPSKSFSNNSQKNSDEIIDIDNDNDDTINESISVTFASNINSDKMGNSKSNNKLMVRNDEYTTKIATKTKTKTNIKATKISTKKLTKNMAILIKSSQNSPRTENEQSQSINQSTESMLAEFLNENRTK